MLHAPITVEFHTWTDGAPQHRAGSVDVSRFVTNVTWTDSLKAPWTNIQLELKVPFRYIRDIIPGRKVPHGMNTGAGTNELQAKGPVEMDTRYGYIPEPGFWVVVRNVQELVDRGVGPIGVALALGRVHTIHFGMATTGGSGAVITTPISITAESFLAFLGRSQLAFAPQGSGVWGMEGFVYDIQNWGKNLDAMIKSVLSGHPGELLGKLWPEIVRIELPPSISDHSAPENEGTSSQEAGYKPGDTVHARSTIADLIPVVFDEVRAGVYAPMRKGQVHAVVGGTKLPSMGALLPNQPSILQFFLTTFYANHEAVEFFSAMDYPADSVKTRLTVLGEAMGGAQPAVFYRMKPWATSPINRSTVLATSEARSPEKAALMMTMPKAGIPEAANPTASPAGTGWYVWERGEVETASIGWSDNMRVNLVFGSWCFATTTDPAMYGLTGTPIVPDKTTIKRHGLRVYAMRWPFFPQGAEAAQAASSALNAVGNAAAAVANTADILAPAGNIAAVVGGLAKGVAVVTHVASKVIDVKLTDYNNAMIEMAWMMAGDGQRWCSGSFSGLYKPQVKQGNWMTVNWADATLTGYIDSVSHSVRANPDGSGWHKATTVNFVRGTLRHQDTPSHQFRLETRGSNPPGAPTTLTGMFENAVVDGIDLLKKLQEKAVKVARDIKGGNPTMLTSSVPLIKPSKTQVSQEKICVVVHYTNGTSTAAMLNEFNKQRTLKGKPPNDQTNYNTSTHYSVDPNGVVMQWLDPTKYSANHVAGSGFPAQSIGVDIIATPSQAATLPDVQRNAVACLFAHLRQTFKIKQTVAPQLAPYEGPEGAKIYKRKTGTGYKDDKYSITDIKKNNWGFVRHRDCNNTSCPGQIPLEDLVALAPSGKLTIVPMDAATQAATSAQSKAAGTL